LQVIFSKPHFWHSWHTQRWTNLIRRQTHSPFAKQSITPRPTYRPSFWAPGQGSSMRGCSDPTPENFLSSLRWTYAPKCSWPTWRLTQRVEEALPKLSPKMKSLLFEERPSKIRFQIKTNLTKPCVANLKSFLYVWSIKKLMIFQKLSMMTGKLGSVSCD